MLLFLLIAGAVVPDDEGFSYTITVHGQPLIRQARWDLIIALKRMGWKARHKEGLRTVFKPPRAWLGRADLDADGNLSFRYPVVRFRQAGLSSTEPVDVTESNPNLIRAPGGHVGDAGFTLPAGEARMWLLPSRVILDGWYAKTRRAVEPELRTLYIAKRDTEVAQQLEQLVEGLDALWEKGTPLVGNAPIPQPRRQQTILLHWATRADTFAGRQATLAIEAWLRNTVELSDEQRLEAEALRKDGRTLSR